MAQGNGNGAIAANVSPECKSKRIWLCLEQTSAASVGPESKDHGKSFEIMIEDLRRSFPVVMSKSRRKHNGFHGFCSTRSVKTHTSKVSESEHHVAGPVDRQVVHDIDNSLTKHECEIEHRREHAGKA